VKIGRGGGDRGITEENMEPVQITAYLNIKQISRKGFLRCNEISFLSRRLRPHRNVYRRKFLIGKNLEKMSPKTASYFHVRFDTSNRFRDAMVQDNFFFQGGK